MGWLKKILPPLIILMVAVAVVTLLTWARPKPESQSVVEAAAPKIQAIIAAPKPHQIVVYTQGTVRPKREIALSTQVSGQVVEVADNFVDGGFFKRGDELLKLDARDYEIEIIRARSRVAEAEQLLATEEGRAFQAKREWRDLGNKAGNTLFLRKPQLKAAKAAVEAAKADLDQAILNLERTSIRAPFDGRVRRVQVNLGQYLTVAMNVAQIFSIDTAEIKLPLTSSQSELLALPIIPDQDVQLPVRLANSQGEVNWQGQISRTDASIDPRSRVIYGIVEVDNPLQADPPLVVGAFVNAEVVGRRFENVQAVPRMALYEKDNLLTVGGDQRLSIQPVKVLQSRGETAYVSGVAQGDVILVDRPGYVIDGMKIEPVIVQAANEVVLSP